MARRWQRIFKLLLVLIPVLSSILVLGKDASAEQNHTHFIHDHIAPVPAKIAANAAQNTILYQKTQSILNRPAAEVSAAPSDVGQWSAVKNWPLVAVHIALMPDETVLMFDAWEFGSSPSARLWDPYSEQFAQVPNTTSGLFCAGQTMLADGRQLVSGGHNGGSTGINHTNIFDWQTHSWSRVSNMNYDRWYPTTLMLGDGRVLALGGQVNPTTYVYTPEVYNPTTNVWTELTQAPIPVGNYPYIFLMPNGKVFNITDNEGDSSILDVNTQTWTDTSTSPLYYVNAVMYRPGKLMMVGGANEVGNFTYVTDLNQTTPAWRATAPMTYPRFLHNLISLPDGKVLVIGGSDKVDLLSKTGVLQSEIWDPDTETWSQLTPMQHLRLYHSTALLLPDGRVMVAGGGKLDGTIDYPDAEIYSPPYLFKGSRPTITSAPGSAPYSSNMTVNTPDAASIASVSFVRLSSVTHAINTDQRYIPLTFTKNAGSLTVQAPSNPNIAPPGYYMLFILKANGVPSVAKIVHLGNNTQPPIPTHIPTFTPTVVPPTSPPYATPAAHFYSTRKPTLTWNDVSWALNYEIEIDNDANFGTPIVTINNLPANNLSYTLTQELPDGIYYWRVRAKKNATEWGNWSPRESFVVDG